MFYEITIEDYVRVDPKYLGLPKKEAVLQALKEEYTGKISKELGIVIGVIDVLEVGQGKIIPEDGGVWFPTKFKILTFKPEINELVLGIVNTVTDFGAFINIGPLDALVHISQIMDDVVSYSKEGVLMGKNTKRVLKIGDIVRARIIAVSYKDPTNPKVACTMRQPGLGKLEWIEEEKEKAKKKK